MERSLEGYVDNLVYFIQVFELLFELRFYVIDEEVTRQKERAAKQ